MSSTPIIPMRRLRQTLGHRSPGVWFLNVMGGKAHADTLYLKLAQIASIISKNLRKIQGMEALTHIHSCATLKHNSMPNCTGEKG